MAVGRTGWKRLKKELAEYTEVTTLSFDVRDQQEVKKSIGSLPERWKAIDVLINNAGNAHGFDPIQSGKIEDWDAMMDINVKGLLYVSREIIPGMTERKRGHIINLGSIAGKEVYPNGNVYCASKFAVDALTQGIRMDLNPFGIKVTGINPGLVETEFALVRFKGDQEKAGTVYKGIQPLKGEDIADIILYVLSCPATRCAGRHYRFFNRSGKRHNCQKKLGDFYQRCFLNFMTTLK